MTTRRRWVAIVAMVSVLTFVGFWLLTWRAATHHRRDAACEFAVAQQDKDRAMWLWLADYITANNPDDEDRARGVSDMLSQLDVLLPRLRCNDGTATPVVAP